MACILGTAGALIPLGPPAGAQTTRPFSALASASGTRVSYTIPGYIAVESVLDTGAPVAESTLQSSGLSTAFASSPYPGATVLSLPGTGAAFGAPTGDIKYPLVATADYPTTPTADLVDPTDQYALHADAAAEASHSNAHLRLGTQGLNFTNAATESSVDIAADGTVKAAATTTLDGVSLADGLVRIGSVRATSTTSLPPTGDPVTSADLVIAGATVAGQNIGINADGITLGSTAVHVPANALLDGLRGALGDAGVTLRIVHGGPVEGGGSADILEIDVRHTTPPPGPPEATLVYRIGGATTLILTGEAVPPLATTTTVSAAPGVTPTVPAAGTATAQPAPPTTTLGASPASVPASIRHDRSLIDVSGAIRFFYIVIAAGGALGLAGSTAWTTLGVRGMVNRQWLQS